MWNVVIVYRLAIYPKVEYGDRDRSVRVTFASELDGQLAYTLVAVGKTGGKFPVAIAPVQLAIAPERKGAIAFRALMRVHAVHAWAIAGVREFVPRGGSLP